MTGEELERLMMGVFLMGYGDGYRDTADYLGGDEPSGILSWAIVRP